MVLWNYPRHSPEEIQDLCFFFSILREDSWISYLFDTELQFMPRCSHYGVNGLQIRQWKLLTAHYMVPQQVRSSTCIEPGCNLPEEYTMIRSMSGSLYRRSTSHTHTHGNRSHFHSEHNTLSCMFLQKSLILQTRCFWVSYAEKSIIHWIIIYKIKRDNYFRSVEAEHSFQRVSKFQGCI